MNLQFRLTRAFFISLLFAVAFGLTAILISARKIALIDSSIISFIQGWESPALTSLMKFFSFIGSGEIVAVLSVAVLFLLYKVFNHRSELVLFIGVVAGAGLLNEVLKSLFHRERPSLHRLVEETGFSFPSGHSMEAVAFYGIVAYLLWRHVSFRAGRGILIMASLFMILAIGVSRIYLGVHYPSDVLGGFLASGFWIAAAIWAYGGLFGKNKGS